MNFDSIGVVAQILTALGIGIAVFQLKADHDKSRREFAARLIWEWTLNIRRNSKISTKFVDQLNANECKAIFNQETFTVSKNHKSILEAIISGTEYKVEIDDGSIVIDISLSSYLRSTVTGYLNLLESVFVAWHHKVGDRKIIEQQFRFLINPEGENIFLHTYLDICGGSKHYPMITEYVAYLRKNEFPQGTMRLSAG